MQQFTVCDCVRGPIVQRMGIHVVVFYTCHLLYSLGSNATVVDIHGRQLFRCSGCKCTQRISLVGEDLDIKYNFNLAGVLTLLCLIAVENIVVQHVISCVHIH